jgi:hypothetical protein
MQVLVPSGMGPETVSTALRLGSTVSDSCMPDSVARGRGAAPKGLVLTQRATYRSVVSC